MYDLLGTREQHEQSGQNKYQARDYLALHLSITKHETLGQQSPQESHHHHGIKQLSEGCREKDANGQHNQLEIDKQGESVRQEEAIETDHGDIILRSPEGEMDHHNEHHSHSGTADGGEQHDIEAQQTD